MGRTKVQRAAAEVEKLTETLARWESEVAAVGAELADLESRIGAEVLDDESAAGRLTGEMNALRARKDVAARAAVAAHERLVEARRGVLRARAGELRDEAAALRADADKRQVKTDRLMAELSEWEGGARYLPYEPSSLDIVSAGAAGVSYTIPRTRKMRMDADGLERQAVDLETRAEQHPEAVERSVARVLAPAA